ncbi:MAG: sensor histidine kinase [Halarchaeum sp.]
MSDYERADGDGTRVRQATRRLVLAGIAAVGPLSVLAFLAETAVFDPAVVGGDVSASQGGELAFTVVLAFVFVGAAYLLSASELGAERYRRIGAWTFGGLVLFLAVNLVLIVITPAPTLQANVAWARGTAVFGAAGGLIIGVVEARSIDRAHQVERARAEAEFAEEQREWFEYLNGLLRHEVLNKASVVQGYATLADEAVDDPTVHDAMATIERQAEEMTSVIEDVRVLIDTPRPEGVEPVELADVLREAAADVTDAHDALTVDIDVPDDVLVGADELVERVFANLFENAVVHDDGDSTVVTVDVVERADTVDIVVADDGSGIPVEKRDALFERTHGRTSTHGLGLYLVRTLVERYDGSVALTDTGPQGTTITVSLPRAADAPAEPARSERTRAPVIESE